MSLIRNLSLIAYFFLYPSTAFGYLDPGSGSALVTVFLSIAGAALFYTKSIVVFIGDHGPYLTGNCTVLDYVEPKNVQELHVRDRIGTLMAVH